jgi:hypothetical protein
VNDEVCIRIPVGRQHDDRLSPVERAFCDVLVDLPPDRLRVLFGEVLTVKALHLEIEELLLGDAGGEA